MGDPRKPKKKYEKPKMLWDKVRIKEEQGLVREYGLKNMKELWRAHSLLRKIRRQARSSLVLGEDMDMDSLGVMNRLHKLGISKKEATINDILGLDIRNVLDRRLQTIVYKKGLSTTVKQSRQLITHGLIKVNGKVVKSPGYNVNVKEEDYIDYSKPIDIYAGSQAKPDKKNTEEAVAASKSTD